MKISNKGASIILINDNKALLMLRDNNPHISLPGYWGPTGGFVNAGEDVKAAAIRELKEETGYICNNPTWYLTEVYRLPNGKYIEAHRFFDFYDKKQEINCYEGQKNAWKSAEEIQSLKMTDSHRYAALAALKVSREG